jgi:hypothetical protein
MTTMNRKPAIAAVCAAALAIAVALAACGGTESDSFNSVARSDKSTGAGQAVEGLAPMASGETSDQATSGGLVLSDQALDRKIIQNTSLDLQVEDVAGSYQKVATIALDAGGFVLDSSVSANEDQPRATLTIRVPSSQYEAVLSSLHGLAVKVVNETSKAEDQTEQYADLQARLRTAQSVEARYLELLDRAETIDDVLKVQNYLTPARLEVEQIQGQINLIDKLSSLATISVSLSTEPPAVVSSDSHPDPLAAAGRGWEGSLLFLRAVGAGLFAAATFLWWLAPVLAIVGVGFLVRYRTTRKSGGAS